jgi:hypothetical protein
MMARDQIKFLLEFCFARRESHYEPVMVRMTLRRSEIVSGTANVQARLEQQEVAFEVPLLTLVGINSLGVDSVQVDFNLDVTSHVPVTNDDETQTKGQRQVRLMGKLSQHGAREVEHQTSSLKVSIRSGTLPLSKGMTTLIDLYSKALVPLNRSTVADKMHNKDDDSSNNLVP